MEVGQKIKLVRLHRGLTQKQLGDLLNLGDGGANRIAQYEIGYRVPKPSLLKEIAKVLDVKEETFFVSDKYLLDILRTIMWYDFEHRRSFKLAKVTLDASIAPIESKAIELRGNACTTWGDSIAPATVLWVNVPLFNDLMKEWLTRKQELASGTITKSEYARRDALIDTEISQKLARCDRQTLLSVNKMLDVLLEQQAYYYKKENE